MEPITIATRARKKYILYLRASIILNLIDV
jgi:hypothetical protein